MQIIKSSGYSIYTGTAVFKKLEGFITKQNYSAFFILCDENTLQNCLPVLIQSCPVLLKANIIEIESGEASKNLQICEQIWQTFAETNADRKSLLINLGGGVVSDLGGFCASVYKRGIDFMNVPTSLLAMADASVGGKTGIDFLNLKNIIGTFTQPKGVFIFPEYLLSLPKRHINNGLAEIFKIALVADIKLWKFLINEKGLNHPEKIIEQSIILKNNIVLKDPFDKGLRKILNFGHTIGHAIESCFLNTPNEHLHGEAVYVGMIIESHLAFQKKLISKKELHEIGRVLIERCPKISLETELLLQLMANDKKNEASAILFSLIQKTGKGIYNIKANSKQINSAVLFYNSLIV